MKKRVAKRIIIIFLIFGLAYYIIELIYDGTSHPTMFICAGITGVLAYYIEENFNDMRLINKLIIITSNILILEYVVGYIFNIYLKRNIWDYSNNSYNIRGQVCLLFGAIWFFIFGPLIVWLTKNINYGFSKKDKPHKILYYYLRLIKDIIESPYVIFLKLQKLLRIIRKRLEIH